MYQLKGAFLHLSLLDSCTCALLFSKSDLSRASHLAAWVSERAGDHSGLTSLPVLQLMIQFLCKGNQANQEEAQLLCGYSTGAIPD